MAVVLVTGASGFLGRHALTALRSDGHEVHGLSRRPPADDACIWHVGDMLDADAVARLIRSLRPSHLLHLAWVMEHGRYWTSPENVRWVEATMEHLRSVERLDPGIHERRFERLFEERSDYIDGRRVRLRAAPRGNLRCGTQPFSEAVARRGSHSALKN